MTYYILGKEFNHNSYKKPLDLGEIGIEQFNELYTYQTEGKLKNVNFKISDSQGYIFYYEYLNVLVTLYVTRLLFWALYNVIQICEIEYCLLSDFDMDEESFRNEREFMILRAEKEVYKLYEQAKQ